MLLIDCWIFYKMLEWIWTYELQLIFCYHISCCLWAVTIHNAMITVYNFVNYFPMIVFEKINVAGSNCVYGVMNVTSSCRLKKRANVQYYTNIWSLWSTAKNSDCFFFVSNQEDLYSQLWYCKAHKCNDSKYKQSQAYWCLHQHKFIAVSCLEEI